MVAPWRSLLLCGGLLAQLTLTASEVAEAPPRRAEHGGEGCGCPGEKEEAASAESPESAAASPPRRTSEGCSGEDCGCDGNPIDYDALNSAYAYLDQRQGNTQPAPTSAPRPRPRPAPGGYSGGSVSYSSGPSPTPPRTATQARDLDEDNMNDAVRSNVVNAVVVILASVASLVFVVRGNK